MLINTILIILIAIGVGVAGYMYYKKLKTQSWEEDYVNTYNLDYLTKTISEIFASTLKQNLKDMNMSRKQLEKTERLKNELRRSLKEAAYGNKNSKRFVINYIKDLLLTHNRAKLTPDTVDKVIHFHAENSLKSREKFEIILYLYVKMYKEKGLAKFLEEFQLKNPVYREDGSFYYDVTQEDIAEVYSQVISRYGEGNLEFMDKIEIIAERIFADYKGFGVTDVLFDTSVDEIDCGVSGIPKDSYDIKQEFLKEAEFSYESVWIMLSGVNIKLSCLSFGTQDELVRVCQNIYKFNAPSSLSRKTGKVVSTMKDGSRIVVCRPPFCESWCFFARKFDSTPSILPEKLFNSEDSFILITLMKWFIKGQRTIAITGSQGSGKSTTLKSLLRYIPEEFNLRVQELAFELNLRYTYPKRNIVTFQETESISAQEGLDLQKKTNGAVNVIGEVATAAAASWIIQTAMVASLYTLFTHHAKTTHDLIIAIRNNLLETGGYNNEKAAEEMVSKVLNIDFHMEKSKDTRFCERITEIIPIRDRRYPSEKITGEEREKYTIEELALLDQMEYQKRTTDRQVFTSSNICEYVDGKYYMRNMPTEELMLEIRSKLSLEEEKQFLKDMAVLEKMIVPA